MALRKHTPMIKDFFIKSAYFVTCMVGGVLIVLIAALVTFLLLLTFFS